MKIYQGDCLEVMSNLDDQSCDAIIADLPYGMTKAKWDCEIDLTLLWQQYKRIAKPDAPILLFGSQPFTSKLITTNPSMFKFCWYWVKEKGTGFLNAKRQPLRCIEEICVFYRQQPTYNPERVKLETPYRHKLPTKQSELMSAVGSCGNGVEYREYTHSYPKNLLCFPRDNSNKGKHSTQKPLALLEYLVKTHTNEGDVILDNTMGFGSTGVAALSLKRDFVGIERDERMFAEASLRLAA